MNFIDKHSDLNTVNYLSKSMNSEVIEKALDKTGLVQKEIQYTTASGKTATRKQWVKVGEDQPEPDVNTVPKAEEENTHKREVLPATPFTITDKIKHLKPISEFDEIPSFLKAIPPNWREVLISPDMDHNILAVGKDEQNRPQYIYHPDWVAEKKEQKFNRVHEIVQKKEELALFISGIEDKEVSDCLTLIMKMGIRPGSERDTKSKVEAIGASTLRGEHVVEENGDVYLRFIGKKGVNQDHKVPDELKDMLLERKKKAGNNGKLFNTTDSRLRICLKPFGNDIKVKDLRTMLATSTAEEYLADIEPVTDVKEFAKIRNSCGDVVCEKLGNQRSMSLGSYIDPAVFERWSPEGYKAWKEKDSKNQ